jgi:hypothetical protein
MARKTLRLTDSDMSTLDNALTGCAFSLETDAKVFYCEDPDATWVPL